MGSHAWADIPVNPNAQSSHLRPIAPGWHWHLPVTISHSAETAKLLQLQAMYIERKVHRSGCITVNAQRLVT